MQSVPTLFPQALQCRRPPTHPLPAQALLVQKLWQGLHPARQSRQTLTQRGLQATPPKDSLEEKAEIGGEKTE